MADGDIDFLERSEARPGATFERARRSLGDRAVLNQETDAECLKSVAQMRHRADGRSNLVSWAARRFGGGGFVHQKRIVHTLLKYISENMPSWEKAIAQGGPLPEELENVIWALVILYDMDS